MLGEIVEIKEYDGRFYPWDKVRAQIWGVGRHGESEESSWHWLELVQIQT